MSIHNHDDEIIKRNFAPKNRIHFYSADSNHIIGYGDINGKRVFKITYSDSRYFAHKLSGRAYKPLGEAQSLDGAKNLCIISI